MDLWASGSQSLLLNASYYQNKSCGASDEGGLVLLDEASDGYAFRATPANQIKETKQQRSLLLFHIIWSHAEALNKD